MLLASPLPCDNLATLSHRASILSPPFSPRQRPASRTSAIPLNIQRTCNALQSLLAGAAPTSTPRSHNTSVAPIAQSHAHPGASSALLRSPALVQTPTITAAPKRPDLQKRRTSRLSIFTTRTAPTHERTANTPITTQEASPKTPPLALRGANKRRRSDSDDASRSNAEQQQPSTPKRQRKLPVELPQGLKESDFESLPEEPALLRQPPLPRRRSYQDDQTVRLSAPPRVSRRPPHHRRASSSAMMSLFFTHLQLDTSTQATSSQPQQPLQNNIVAIHPQAKAPSALHAPDTPLSHNTMMLQSWHDAQLEQISRGMAVRGRMRIRRPLGGRAERPRVDGMGWTSQATEWQAGGFGADSQCS